MLSIDFTLFRPENRQQNRQHGSLRMFPSLLRNHRQQTDSMRHCEKKYSTSETPLPLRFVTLDFAMMPLSDRILGLTCVHTTSRFASSARLSFPSQRSTSFR